MKKIISILISICFLLGAGVVLASEPPSSLPIWKKTFSTEEGRGTFKANLVKNDALVDGQIVRSKLDSFIYAAAKEKGYDKYVGQLNFVNQEVYAKAFWGWNGMLSNGAKGDLPETISLDKLFAKYNRIGLYYPMHIGVYADLRRFKSQISSLKGEDAETNALIMVAREVLEKGEFTQAMKDGMNIHMIEYLKPILAEVRANISTLKTEAKTAKVERKELRAEATALVGNISTLETEAETAKAEREKLGAKASSLTEEIAQTRSLIEGNEQKISSLEAGRKALLEKIIVGAVIVIIVMLLVFAFAGTRLMKWAKAKFASCEDLEELSNAFHSYTFDVAVVAKDKLEALSQGESISLPLTSEEDGLITNLKVEKTGENQVTIVGALRQVGDIQPLVIDSLVNIARAIKRAASQQRIVGVS